jgi:hypothetical protein
MLVAFAAALPATAQPCTVPDNGSGTVDLPPAGCGYVSPDDLHIMIDQVDPSTTIRISPQHLEFFNVLVIPGAGGLGGDEESFSSQLCMDLEGTGALAGYVRPGVCFQAEVVTHTAPRNPGDPVQTFPTEMFSLSGELFGDPDFDVLRVTAGLGNGLPSPGETTLTQLPSGNFNVDSFFDVSYKIEFQGKPGTLLEGFGGSTTDTVRMNTGEQATMAAA